MESSAEYLAKFQGVSNYHDQCNVFSSAVNRENEYRKLFAQVEKHPSIQDPYTFLIPVHQNVDAFKYRAEYPEEKAIPRCFPVKQRKPADAQAICDVEQFKSNLDIFTEGSLRFLNWENLFLAGGSVLACLTTMMKDRAGVRTLFQDKAYRSSDVDLFIYGLSEAEGLKKLEEVYQSIIEAVPYRVIAFRSSHAVTVVSQFPYRHVQIVLRLYRSPAEILMGFDVDVCSVGFDGKAVWCTPRAHNAITAQHNTIDMTRRSPSYEMRLAKYADRGYEVLVPALDRARIDPQLFEKPFHKLQGLSRLLLLERFTNPEERYRYRQQMRARRLRPTFEKRGYFWNQLSRKFRDTEDQMEWLALTGVDASDYSTVFLPWGAMWTADRTAKIMRAKDYILNAKWYDKKNKKMHTHPCFFGTMSQVLRDCCGKCPQLVYKKDKEEHEEEEEEDGGDEGEEEEEELFDDDGEEEEGEAEKADAEETYTTDQYVSGKLTFITINPGRQMIGSFNPINEGDWTAGAYISAVAEDVCSAISRGAIAELDSVLASAEAANSKDPLGRSAIHLAVLCNQLEMFNHLVSKGASPAVPMVDGRNVLHLAAAYGHVELVKAILDIIKKDEERQKADPAYGAAVAAKKDRMKRSKTKNEEGKNLIVARDEMPLLLIDSEDWDNKMTALHYAILFGHVDIIQLLLDAGADVNQTVYYAPPQECNLHVSYTCLYLASLGNKEVSVSIGALLLEKGCSVLDLDHHHRTVLHCVVLDKNITFAQMLFETDPKTVQAANMLGFGDSRNLQLPISDAIRRRDIAMVQLLLKHGSKVEVDDAVLKDFQRRKKRSPLQERLRGYGPDNTTVDNLEQPLRVAVNQRWVEGVKLLLEANANVSFWFKYLQHYDEYPLQQLETELADLKEAAQTAKQMVERKLSKQSDATSYLTFRKVLIDQSLCCNETLETLQHNQEKADKTVAILNEVVSALLSKHESLGGTRPVKKENEQGGSMFRSHYPFGRRAMRKTITARVQDEPVQDDDVEGQQAKAALADKEPLLLPPFRFKTTGRIFRHTGTLKYAHKLKLIKLYESAWAGDIEALNRLTSEQDPSMPVCVAVEDAPVGTPVQLALLRGHTAYANRVLQIAEEQYSPIPTLEETPDAANDDDDDEEEEISHSMNNLDLVAMAEDEYDGDELDPREIDASLLQPARKMKKNINPSRKEVPEADDTEGGAANAKPTSRYPPWMLLLDTVTLQAQTVPGLESNAVVTALAIAVMKGNNGAVNDLLTFAKKWDGLLAAEFAARDALQKQLAEVTASMKSTEDTAEKEKCKKKVTALKRKLLRFMDLDQFPQAASLIEAVAVNVSLVFNNMYHIPCFMNPSAVTFAIAFNRLDLLKLLIQEVGAGFDFSYLLEEAAGGDHDDGTYSALQQFKTEEEMQQEQRRKAYQTNQTGRKRPYLRRVNLYHHPVMLAAYYGRKEILQFLLSEEPEQLMNQFMSNRFTIPRSEPAVDSRRQHYRAPAVKNDRLAKLLQLNLTGQEIWRKLVALDATTVDDCNIFGWAVRGDQPEIIKLLGRHTGYGADSLKKEINRSVNPPLHVACSEGRVDCVAALLSLGADPFLVSKSSHLLAIHDAIIQNHLPVLVKLGELLPAEDFKRMLGVKTDKAKESVLMFATHYKRTDVIQFLLDQNQDLLTDVDYIGNSAVMYALSAPNEDGSVPGKRFAHWNVDVSEDTQKAAVSAETVLKMLLSSKTTEQATVAASVLQRENHVGNTAFDLAMFKFWESLRTEYLGIYDNRPSFEVVDAIRSADHVASFRPPRSLCTFDDMTILAAAVSKPSGPIPAAGAEGTAANNDVVYDVLFPNNEEPIEQGVARFPAKKFVAEDILRVDVR